MSLLQALVARGTTVLAEHSSGDALLKPGSLHRTLKLLTISCQNHDPVQDPAEQLQAYL